MIRKCILRFAITANFLDEFELDVVLPNISSIVLGSPHFYDRREIFNSHDNKYHFFKNGIKYIVTVHSKETSLSLMHVGQMKRIVNSVQKHYLLMFKHEDVVNEAFQGDASNENYDFIKVANGCEKMF